MAAKPPTERREDARYVLITECLQNDFILNPECRLSLPEPVARLMLLGQKRFQPLKHDGRRGSLPSDAIAAGPLGLFLDRTIGRRRRGEDGKGVLHVINIRDWHVPDENYDFERRRYGAHCEEGSWGAAYVDGLKQWLDPGNADLAEKARYFEEGSVRIHHVHADSIFDFRPSRDRIGAGERKFRASRLEMVLDVIVQGSDADLERAREIMRTDPRPAALEPITKEIDLDDNVRSNAPLYVAVIGVYTDIKVAIVLAGLRTRYVIPNLAVSDTFTASSTLERHLNGLDFAAKLLNTEVVHGINDLVAFLGGKGDLEDESKTVAADSFSRYQSYFQDRQNVLAYSTEKLQEYELLTQPRSIKVYETIRRANTVLIVWGTLALVSTLVLTFFAAFGKAEFTETALMGGITLASFVGVFFTRPSADLQRNLTNLAVFKMILESHSLKTAIARFHLTTPQALRELKDEDEAKVAEAQVTTLQKELEAMEDVDRADFAALDRLGFGRNGGKDKEDVPPVPAPSANGAAPTPDATAAGPPTAAEDPAATGGAA
jgi:hypothetical protein